MMHTDKSFIINTESIVNFDFMVTLKFHSIQVYLCSAFRDTNHCNLQSNFTGNYVFTIYLVVVVSVKLMYINYIWQKCTVKINDVIKQKITNTINTNDYTSQSNV